MDHDTLRKSLREMVESFTPKELEEMSNEATQQRKSVRQWAYGLLIGIPRAWEPRSRICAMKTVASTQGPR